MSYTSVFELFDAAVERFGDCRAIEDGERKVTFRELDQRVSSLTQRLSLAGASQGAVVGVVAEDVTSLVVALLGTMRAGCVYVYLEPNIPAARLAAMIEEVTPRFVVAERGVFCEEMIESAEVIYLEEGEEGFTQRRKGKTQRREEGMFANEVGPEDMCYVFFTSGSTGKPKGIAGRRKGIDHFINWEIKTLGLGPGVRVSQLVRPSFDAFLRDVLLPLCNGGTICVPPDRETVMANHKLVEWLDAQQINVVHCVPSLFRSIANAALDANLFSSLKYILLSGEPLLPADVKRWTDIFGDRIQLINLYGATETTMTKFFYFVNPADKDRRSIPIGKPMEGARAAIVDAQGRMCSTGEVGEIYIRTPFSTLGYYNQPELTSEVFVPNPLSQNPNDLVYKSGDLGRVLEDGNFEYLGRKDLQVKIRGARVELPAIENFLRHHEAVEQAVVTDRDDSLGNKYLCAFVVMNNGYDVGLLKPFLANLLPDYMVPSMFVRVDEMPVTPSGKIDRQALNNSVEQLRAREQRLVQPRTPLEATLTDIWKKLLRLESVGIHDNFFDCGGHSLLATQVVSSIREFFNVELPLRVVFEQPTIAGLAASVEQAMSAGQRRETPPIMPLRKHSGFPLSFAQQRLWFIDQLQPENNYYNIPAAVRLSGPLNVLALRRVLGEIVRRHQSLRTRFEVVESEALQVIHQTTEARLPLIDLCALDEEAREAEARRLMKAESERPFNLQRGPLLRATLLKLAGEEHLVLLTMHHIVSDGWSVGVLVREVAILYEAYSQGQESPLPDLPLQYAHFAVWQRGWLQGDVLDQQLSYWKQQLAGAPPVLELPLDYPRPAVQTYHGSQVSFRLSRTVTTALKEIGRRERATLFMTLLAAWQTFLSAYTGRTDIVTGADVANRNRSETENLIGFFVNMLVLRTDLSGNPTFRELIGRVREVALGAYAHQDVPFEKLVEELQPQRDLSRNPLFQVLLVLQNVPMEELQLSNLKLSPVEVNNKRAPFDLLLDMMEHDGCLGGAVRYNTDLFARESVERMIRHFETLLQAIVEHPERRLSEFAVLPREEQQLALKQWNDTATNYPQTACINELFEQQVELTPAAVAVIFGDPELTYRELNARANQLAHYLQTLGVGPEVPVGICVQRSFEMLVGLLGILKAGGVYVPLDPELPLERLSFIIQDSQLAVLLTQEHLLDLLPSFWGQITCLDSEWDTIATLSDSNPVNACVADNLAYVIYTSGSTGQPKGTGVPHRAVVRLVKQTNYFDLIDREVFLQLAPLAFDASTFEIWGSLLNGARLAIAPPQSPSLAELAATIKRHQVSTLWLTAGLFHLMVDEHLEDLKGVRQLLAGGDVLAPGHVRKYLQASEGKLINGYGPTESTTFACCYSMTNETEIRGSVPIGFPIANTQAYVLDEYLRPVPLGVIGDLYLAGDGLARGYINRPELTAEKFIPHPHSEDAGARLYRTGDRARYLPDGCIEFVGRNDLQVKIRGYRIELSEIELMLGRHPAVRDCVVVVRGEDRGDKRLVAYLTVADEQLPAAKELREFLGEKLPEYMVPAVYVQLDQLPLTPNGKIDRRALPDPEGFALNADHECVAPNTEVEAALVSIWEEILGAKQVSLTDNFFDLGGHSLLATQLISRVRERFRIELPLRSVFEMPRLDEFAQTVESAVSGPRSGKTTIIRPVQRNGHLPLSFAQQRLWFLHQLVPDSPFYNIPAAVRLTGRLDQRALAHTFTEIVRRHEVLRTAFTMVQGEPVQEVRPAEPVEIPVVDLRVLPAAEREPEAVRLAIAEGFRPFDLSQPPLLRVLQLQLADDEQIFCLTMHHIVSDGWSTTIFIREVVALYEAFVQGKPSPLPELPIQYADFAAWQREWLQGKVLEEQLSYWRRQLDGAPTVLELPTNRERPTVQTHRGGRQRMEVDNVLLEQLKELGQQETSTLFMVLLATFQVLLCRYSGQEDILVGSVVANRNRAETENLIGFFVNTLVLRGVLKGDPTFRELLRQAREVTLGAYAHQDLPFERLVDELQPERELSRQPLFQVMFALQNMPREDLELVGLKLSRVHLADLSAKFDLMLVLEELDEGLVGALEYNSDLFNEATITGIARHFRKLLESVVAAPDCRIQELQMLSDEEAELLELPITLDEFDTSFSF